MPSNYKNTPEILDFIESHIQRMGIDDSFKPLLTDVMLRRVSEFSFSEQEAYEDISSLMNNLKEINIGPMPMSFRNAGGVYFSAEKKITLSENYVKKANTPEDFEVLYEIFTHEVFHALARDKFGNAKISSHNKYTKEFYGSLEEAIVEKAADRCVFGRNKRDGYSPFFHQNKFGYPDITYITDIIESTYGVTEIAFLRNAIQGRQKAAEFLSDVGGETVEDTLDYFDRIELNYTTLHNSLYTKRMPPEESARVIRDVMTAGLLVSSWKMNENIERLDVNQNDFASRVSEFKYFHDKFFVVSRHAAQTFENRFPGQNISDYVLTVISDTRADNSFRINTMSEILKRRADIPEEDFYKMIDTAKKGVAVCYRDENEEDLFKTYDIPLFNPKFIPLENEEVDSYRRMDFELTNWDNFGVVQETRRLQYDLQKSNRRNPIIDALRNGLFRAQSAISEYFDKDDPKLLGPGEEQTKNDEKQASSFGRLSEEELAKFEKGMSQVLREYNSNQGRESQEQNEKKNDELEF